MAWLCDAANLVQEIEIRFKNDDVVDRSRARLNGAAALRRLRDRIPLEILNDSICIDRCGHYVATLMHAIYDAENASSDFWIGGRDNDLRFLDRLLMNMKREAYLKATDNLRRMQSSTARSLFEYIASLKSAYSKIMVMRLDLHFPWHRGGACATTGLERQQWEALLHYVKSSFKSFLGYVAKFEVGSKRGIHLHTVLVFNGSLVQSDVKIARMIGEYWRCDIQKGRAGYFNGNSKDYLERMRWPAVGTFTEASEAFLKVIRNISEYLAKPDPLVRIALPQIGRSLRRSCLTVGQRRRIARRMALAERRLMGVHASTGGKKSPPPMSTN